MDKLNEMMASMAGMATKNDLERFATKTDVEQLRDDLTKHVKTEVGIAIGARLSPVENRLAASEATTKQLQVNLAELQKEIASGSVSRRGSSTFNPADPGHKRISFLGISAEFSAGERVTKIEKWFRDNFKDARFSDVGNFFSGSFKEKTRKLTTVAYIEFANSDARNAILNEIERRKLKIETMGADVGIKKALTESALARNGVLKSVSKLLKADHRTQGKTVEMVMRGERGVTVDKVYAFQQPNSGYGTFSGEFHDLVLPSRGNE